MATLVRKNKEDRRNEVGGTFRILAGGHFGDGPTGCDCDECAKDGKNHHYRPRRYDKEGISIDPEGCDIILSPSIDLAMRFGAERFQRLHPHDSGYVVPTSGPKSSTKAAPIKVDK